MIKEYFQPPFSALVIEINDEVLAIRSSYIYAAEIVNGELNSIKITQLLDGLEISISGVVKTGDEY